VGFGCGSPHLLCAQRLHQMALEEAFLKILLSALACEPGRGSEPEVGFRTMLAAASHHEVWVLTASESIAAIERALLADPRASRIHLEGIEFGVSAERIINMTAIGYHWRYDKWQRAAAARGLHLDRIISFDVVHHATLASYWTRAGVAVVEKPLVWGPIGGGVDPPLRLLPELGARGILEAVARIVGRPVAAMLPPVKKTQRVAAVILAQNPDTGRRLRGAGKMKLLSHSLAVELDGVKCPGSRTADLLLVGRLIPWKAPMLALRALRYVEHPEAVLRFCGDGPERARLKRAAQKWGLRDRVRFEGWIPRSSLLPLLARAGALVHPAVHDEAPLGIAEALALGTPVVVLDHGGPSQIVGQWKGPSALVSPSSPDATARSMAAAIDRFLLDPPPPQDRPMKARTSFRAELLRCYDEALAS
jgi:glycosyltransferase involved in cell wall biosynthesis